MSTSRLNDRRLAAAPEKIDDFPGLAAVRAQPELTGASPGTVEPTNDLQGVMIPRGGRQLEINTGGDIAVIGTTLGSWDQPGGAEGLPQGLALSESAPFTRAAADSVPAAFAGTGGPSVTIASVARRGTEILVNTTTNNYQSKPQITALSNGGFVVTWEDRAWAGWACCFGPR